MVPTLKHVSLMVADNRLNQTKCSMISEMLRRMNVNSVALRNIALILDWEEKEFSSFEGNVREIREMPITKVISWRYD